MITDIFSFRWKVCAKLIKLVCQLRCPIKKVFFNFGYVCSLVHTCVKVQIFLFHFLSIGVRFLYCYHEPLKVKITKKNYRFIICLKTVRRAHHVNKYLELVWKRTSSTLGYNLNPQRNWIFNTGCTGT